MSVIYQLSVITPEKQVLDKEVDFLVAPGVEGCFGVLPGHAPLVTLLKAGELAIGWGEKPELYAVSGGYAEVMPDRVTLLVERAIAKADIDPKVATTDLTTAEDKLQGLSDDDPEAGFWAKQRDFAMACLEVFKKKS